MRRVVVTGLGMVSPLACGVEPSWQRLVKGESGAREAGKFRLEGKEYVVADGDVLHFRFAN